MASLIGIGQEWLCVSANFKQYINIANVLTLKIIHAYLFSIMQFKVRNSWNKFVDSSLILFKDCSYMQLLASVQRKIIHTSSPELVFTGIVHCTICLIKRIMKTWRKEYMHYDKKGGFNRARQEIKTIGYQKCLKKLQLPQQRAEMVKGGSFYL